MKNAHTSDNLITTFKQYIQQIDNRHHLAGLLARMAQSHGDATVQAWAHTWIEQHVPAGEAKLAALTTLSDHALDLSAWTLTTPAEQTLHTPTCVLRLDPELGRLAIALSQAARFRLWVVARDMSRQQAGCGKVTRKAFKRHLSALGISYSRQHLNRLLRRSAGVYFDLSRTHLYPRAAHHVAWHLSGQAYQQCPAAIVPNRPGVRDIYVPVGGTLEAWEAMLYAAWITHREGVTISRQTLHQLFGRTPQTLRNWEQHRLRDILTVRHNYAQAAIDINGIEATYPASAGAHAYVARTGQGSAVRLCWQISNSYGVKGLKQHPRRGQAGKVRRSVNHLLSQSEVMDDTDLSHPAYIRRGGWQGGKWYFDNAAHCRAYLKRRSGIRYLWCGERRRRGWRRAIGIFEATASGYAETRAGERLSFKAEREYFAAQQSVKSHSVSESKG